MVYQNISNMLLGMSTGRRRLNNNGRASIDEGPDYTKAKSLLKFSYSDLLNLAPLTGIAFASNWLISKLNKKCLAVKTTRMTTFLLLTFPSVMQAKYNEPACHLYNICLHIQTSLSGEI